MPNMLVLGDSILWGQGLLEEQKCTTLFARAWENAAHAPVVIKRYAHSGADLWNDGQSGIVAIFDPTPPAFPNRFVLSEGQIQREQECGDLAARAAVGEIPNERPYLIRQIYDASHREQGVDLVVFDAGINDTEVYNLVIPGKDTAAVVARGRSIKPRFDRALRMIAEAFPTAKIMVTGYYPVISRQTRVGELFQFLRRVAAAAVEEGVHLGGRFEHLLESPFEDGVKLGELALESLRIESPGAAFARNLETRCLGWMEATHASIRECIEAFDSQERRVTFVDPHFGPEHAAFAPKTLLWQFRNGQPLDPMAQNRKAWCDQNHAVGFERLINECASMGHPAPEGAQRYAEGLIAGANRLQLF